MRSDRRLIQNPAIVLDLGVNGLGVVRSLGRKGVRVLGVVFAEQGVAGCSRYCEAVDLPKEADETEFLSRLLALCQRMPAPPVLFPTSDESLALLSRYEQELASMALFVLPARRPMLDILNKDGTKRLAMECGMRIPATYSASSFAHLCEIAAGMHYPVLFKPRNHYSVYLPGRAKNITFHEPDELTAYFAVYPHLADMGVFQEIILGGDGHILVCAAYLDRDSEPLAVYTGRKIRQLQPDFGVTSYGISENLPEIADMTICFLQRIRYKGLAAVEYVRDRNTGQVYFLEINARSYYHNSLFLSCGVNLPWIAYLDAVRHPMLAREVMPREKYGLKWVDFARDARSFRLKHKEGQLGWGPWLMSLAQARSFAVFALDDLRPFWHGGRKLVWRQVRKGANRIRTYAGRRRRVPLPHGVPGHVDHAPSKGP
jgi:predicted ATP-grasp superfamily ATP-dependent carboligase